MSGKHITELPEGEMYVTPLYVGEDQSQELSGATSGPQETSEVESLVGRELDAAIAERVMGWVWLSRVNGRGSWLFSPDSKDINTGDEGMFGEPIITRGHIVGPFREYDGGRKEYNDSIPCYSTDIAAAMKILNKADGLWELSRYPYRDDDAEEDAPYELRYSCQLRFGDNLGHGDALTAPDAICYAALKAKEQG